MWQKARIRELSAEEQRKLKDDPMRPGMEFYVLVGKPTLAGHKGGWIRQAGKLIPIDRRIDEPSVERYETNIAMPNGFYGKVAASFVELLPEFVDDILVPTVTLEELAFGD